MASERTEACNLLVVSDLHLSEGLDEASGKFSPREDFFFDGEFARFLAYHARLADEAPRYQGRRWKLILNGDVFCFLQVVARPRDLLHTFDGDEEGWHLLSDLPAGQRCTAANGSLRLEAAFSGQTTEQAGVAVQPPGGVDFSGSARLCALVYAAPETRDVNAALRLIPGFDQAERQSPWVSLVPGQWRQVTLELPEDLQQAQAVQLRVASGVAQSGIFGLDEVWVEPRLSPAEEKYGLGTTAEEAAWKLRRCGAGHPGFFQALARFLAAGHRVVYVKGNHDVDVHWPLVQKTLGDLVVEAAARCPDLAGTDEAQMRANVEFCPWVCYEPGLAYIEHGNQYEPVNFFRDFLDPVLPDDPQRLELPLGSFFVRYIFNFLEAIHPWADNVKPASSYITWAFKQEPLHMLGIIVDNLGLVLQAVWKAFRKRAVVPRVDRSVPARMAARRGLLAGLPPEAMGDVAEVSLNWVAGWWRRILRTLALGGLSFVLLIAVVVLLFQPLLDLIRHGLTRMPWLTTVAQLAGSVLLFVVRRVVERKVESEAEDYLVRAAGDIARILTRHGLAVPYLLFGHTHDAAVVRLPRQLELPYDQWVVNTGTWVQVWSEEERLIRDRKQFTFLELVPGEELGRPTLWHWNDDAGRPAPVLLMNQEQPP